MWNMNISILEAMFLGMHTKAKFLNISTKRVPDTLSIKQAWVWVWEWHHFTSVCHFWLINSLEAHPNTYTPHHPRKQAVVNTLRIECLLSCWHIASVLRVCCVFVPLFCWRTKSQIVQEWLQYMMGRSPALPGGIALTFMCIQDTHQQCFGELIFQFWWKMDINVKLLISDARILCAHTPMKSSALSHALCESPIVNASSLNHASISLAAKANEWGSPFGTLRVTPVHVVSITGSM